MNPSKAIKFLKHLYLKIFCLLKFTTWISYFIQWSSVCLLSGPSLVQESGKHSRRLLIYNSSSLSSSEHYSSKSFLRMSRFHSKHSGTTKTKHEFHTGNKSVDKIHGLFDIPDQTTPFSGFVIIPEWRKAEAINKRYNIFIPKVNEYPTFSL